MQVRKIWYEILVIHAMSFSKRGDSDESCAFPLVSHVRGNNGRKIAINNEAMFSHTVTWY